MVQASSSFANSTKVKSPEPATGSKPPLWAGLSIPVIGVTGPFSSGKTLFGLTICPEETLNIDLEESSALYAGTMPLKKRVSLFDEMGKKLSGKLPTAEQCYDWFEDYLLNQVESGQYRVCFVDPINEIEAGLEQRIRRNPKAFGLTEQQIDRAPGLVWGAMANHWRLFLGTVARKFECFVFATHLGSVWDGGKPVQGKVKAKGKSVLKQLASLYLELKRPIGNDGEVVRLPSGCVIGDIGKERLSKWDPATQQMISLLPPHITDCSPAKIRQYILQPPDYSRLKPEERVPAPAPLTEEDRLHLQLEISENNRVAEEAKALSMQAIADSARRMQAAQASVTTEEQARPVAGPVAAAVEVSPHSPPSSPQAAPAPVTAPVDAPATAATEEKRPSGQDLQEAVMGDVVQEIEKMVGLLAFTPEQVANIFKKYNIKGWADASPDVANTISTNLRNLCVNKGLLKN